MKFGVQSCLKINTCVCLSDLLCGFQQGKKKTEINEIKVKSTTLPRNLIGLDQAFEACRMYLGSKVYISISSAECPCKVWLLFAPFMMMLMHIPFYLSKCALLCWHEFQAPDECSNVIAMCTHCLLTCDGRQDESTHQHTRVFLQTGKGSFYGSSCNPSSGIFLFCFLLFKISFRYLNKCCCSLFK